MIPVNAQVSSLPTKTGYTEKKLWKKKYAGGGRMVMGIKYSVVQKVGVQILSEDDS
ncbi:conserved hypothetical protein [Ricinus communis]|uniref:Uncharacterized protein n=1 Tax=Ricinus communis TaxID=3988 RepID=B9RCD4_RICCO|nr:conserved hypothetical protein [Ricinus communis]